MSRNNIATLLEKYQRGECTPDEKQRVDEWFEAHNFADSRFEQMNPEEQNVWTEALLADIQQSRQKPQKTLWRKLYPYAAAACLALLAYAGVLYVQKPKPVQVAVNDVAPGTAIALLKTGGKTILLDKTGKGLIASNNHTTITKTAGEHLLYAAQQNEIAKAVYDTIQIPAGGRPYQITLADGSKILLNAATTLRFPEHFSAGRKEVLELVNGEIYAEVVHKANAPLQIKVRGQIITDLGTEFNISAYNDEDDLRTTLVEGSINVAAHAINQVLKPGQQAILMADNLTIGPADIEQVTAWKNGYFRFNGERIDVIMRQLARWYNIEVNYSGKITGEVFYGKITRKRNISDVLQMLEKTQKIHFKIAGRRVTVLNKP